MNPIENYLKNLYEIYATGAGVKETSYYGALETLLNEIGKTLKPGVRCIINLKNQGAGIPDGGLFSANQFSKKTTENKTPFDSILPERGVIEIKSTQENIKTIAKSEQVRKYWQRYRQVLVTNYRDFLLLGEDNNGNMIELESFSLAENEAEFWRKTINPRKLVQEKGNSFLEYLKRVMLQQAALNSPQDVAWFLASYARDAKSRLDLIDNLPALTNIRQALENALGIKFEGKKGDQFFRSTLIQTLFYGIFSAWVLWHKRNTVGAQGLRPLDSINNNNLDQNEVKYFDWRTAVFYLNVPIIQTLFHQLSDPNKLRDLDLIDVLDWTGSALNRVKREEFFKKFNEGEAVQYFYEPFLEAFDPNLRKELGVWYTPPEIVKYMVTRVDTVLKEELNISEGLADPNVYILDPCCGTGAYLVEVTRQITNSLIDTYGENYSLLGQTLKDALATRIFGFEILTAPFVIAHLQLGVFLQNLDISLERNERIGVFLTNALTGWQPPNEEAKQRLQQLELYFPELNKEREAADQVKRGKPILVILGNPPYNAYAGTSPAEEEGLVEVYKEGLISDWRIKRYNLDDLYIRFLRLAERCISEQTGKGLVCYISNFSYLGDPSFVVMRQRFLQEFDQLYFDCMNGDSRETGKVTPDGKPDPSVFSTQYNKAGIRVGTAISLMVRKEKRNKQPVVKFRHFWGVNKNQEILDSLIDNNVSQRRKYAKDFDSHYEIVKPSQDNRFSFRPSDIAESYLLWPKLTDLCAISAMNGLMEKRGSALIDIDKDALETRMKLYYDSSVTWEEIEILKTGLTRNAANFIPKKVRQKVLNSENYDDNNLQKYALRPFETRWCYYSSVTSLWNSHRPSLWAQNWPGNQFLMTRPKGVASPEGIPFYFTNLLGDNDFLRGHAYYFPIQLKDGSRLRKQAELTLLDLLDTPIEEDQPVANLSKKAREYLATININNPDENKETAALIWYHALAIGYSPKYLTENADGIRQDFPRIPLPNSQELLLNSAKLGEQIAQLLDTENKNPVGVQGLRPLQKLKQIALISHINNQQLNANNGDFAVNVGWGHGGKEGVTMPGKGKIIERNYSEQELNYFQQQLNLTTDQVKELLGKVTCDVFLNDLAYWKNIPLKVWEYTIGGYQVMKKWLSYREEKLLGRSLKTEEVLEVSNIAKRITAILLLEPELDENYLMIKQNNYHW